MIGDDFFLQRMGLPRWHSCDVFGRAPLEFFFAFPGFCVALLWCFDFDILIQSACILPCFFLRFFAHMVCYFRSCCRWLLFACVFGYAFLLFWCCLCCDLATVCCFYRWKWLILLHIVARFVLVCCICCLPPVLLPLALHANFLLCLLAICTVLMLGKARHQCCLLCHC